MTFTKLFGFLFLDSDQKYLKDKIAVSIRFYRGLCSVSFGRVDREISVRNWYGKDSESQTRQKNSCEPKLLTPGLDNTRLFISLTAGAGTRCMSLPNSPPSLCDSWSVSKPRFTVLSPTIPNEQSSVNPGSSVRLGHKTLRTFMKRSSL